MPARSEIAKAQCAVWLTSSETLPPDLKLAYFYDQSLLVHDSVPSVWEAIIFGLFLSVVILYLFLRNWGTTLVAIVVIPVTVLFTILAMNLCGMSFNLMTLGRHRGGHRADHRRRHRRGRGHHAKMAAGASAPRCDAPRHRGNLRAAAGVHPHAGRGLHSSGVSDAASPACSSAPWRSPWSWHADVAGSWP